MKRILAHAALLRGDLTVPGDKSISHRSIMIGSIANGVTEVTGFLHAADPLSTITCMRSLGVEIDITKERIIINGNGLRSFKKPKSMLDAGNSGTTIRLLSGMLAGQTFSTRISGDEYLVKRPMKRIVEPLRLMGARVEATEAGTPPLQFEGSEGLKAIRYALPIPSAQVKSAVLFAGLFAEGTTQVVETTPSRDHTERMLGLRPVTESGSTVISVTGGTEIKAVPFLVPGDPSSAAFFVVAGLIAQDADIMIRNIGLNPTRIGFLDVLKRMGARITIENRRVIGGEEIGDIAVRHSELHSPGTLSGAIIPNIIDEIPALAVAGAFADGVFEVRDARELRSKECDRIAAVCANLRSLGVTVDEYEDGFAFETKRIVSSGEFKSFGDHRIAMAFGVAALALQSESTMDDAGCVDISFPQFWELLHSLTH
ncbi:MAG TPA: 3-phosphoshikimate 1-carboxyvinyltransferase [Bacteroidota bacterium]|nr:3-phosphoshikimate 1-carboxyvinyltransferase [Bacteroidota bacterium]